MAGTEGLCWLWVVDGLRRFASLPCVTLETGPASESALNGKIQIPALQPPQPEIVDQNLCKDLKYCSVCC